MNKYVIGIDPGVNTGFCVWDMQSGRIARIFTNYIHRAQKTVLEYHQQGELAGVIFEDARLRVWFGSQVRGGKSDVSRLQGAGSVKRDCTIWEDFLSDYGIKYIARSPKDKGVKIDAETFKRITGSNARVSEHARDAFALVAGLTRWPSL